MSPEGRLVRRVLFAIAAAGAVVACRVPTETPPVIPEPDLFLAGTWRTGPIPSGSYAEFSIRAAGGRLSGAGIEYSCCFFSDSLAVSGGYSDFLHTFSIEIRYGKGPTATYVGQEFGLDSLVGTWTGNGAPQSYTTRFYRQPVPPCADSAPLYGAYDPRAPGYIIVFHDSVDVTAEAGRLAERYGFTTTFVWQYALKGFFSADISAATAAVLRCEPSVASVSYDGVVTTG